MNAPLCRSWQVTLSLLVNLSVLVSRADTLELSRLTFIELGAPAVSGAFHQVASGIDLTGSGTGIGGTGDQCSFAYQAFTNDFDVAVRVESLSFGDAWSKAGLMVRESLDTNSTQVTVAATPTINGSIMLSRVVTGASAAVKGFFPASYPATWLRLRRAGDVFTGFASSDGQNWTVLNTANLSLPNGFLLGLAVSSQNPTQLVSAQFRDLTSVTNGVTALSRLDREPLGPSSRHTGLVISEIMYHPATAPEGMNLEFIELFNTQPFFEDISGNRISGDVDFTFPEGTVIQAGAFLVVAPVPADVRSAYGITYVVGGYTKRLSRTAGVIRLQSRAGAVLLDVKYDSRPPWPVAPDGTGHSLVLARPSYGEANPQAWAASACKGGSPGDVDGIPSGPLQNVVINEILAHSALPGTGYVELYNHSNEPADVSGCSLSDQAVSPRFRIPAGTLIPARGFKVFTEIELGFGLSSAGERLFLAGPDDRQVIDAVRYEAQELSVPLGRVPDGGPDFYRLLANTPGAPNSEIRVSDVVINEVMYKPMSREDDGTYIEIHNRGAQPVALGDWRFVAGIGFVFPTNTAIAAGGYLVVAKNAARLISAYPNLNSGNTLGDFQGNLAGRGERVALAKPESVVGVSPSGQLVTNTVYVVVDEVTYGSGGRWGQWADGGGSSLELRDPRSDHRKAANWGASLENDKAEWTTIECTGVLDQGAYDTASVSINSAAFMLLGAGACLLDDVEVVGVGGTNLVKNPDFSQGLTSWTVQGDHIRSFLAPAAGINGGPCMQVEASDRGDTGANHVYVMLARNNAVVPGETVTLRARVRWLRGSPDVLLRLRGNWLEAAGGLSLPKSLGTPGAPNSIAVANVGPTICAVAHFPVLPVPDQPIVVTARVHDADGLGDVRLNYRIDPDATFTSLTMRDDGTGGDEVGGDGILSATIPGQPVNTMVAFHIQATDGASAPASSLFPNDAPVRECLVRVGEGMAGNSFGTYRIWMTKKTATTWAGRRKNSNDPLDVTFVYGSQRVVYNAGSLYSGSPWHTPSFNGPTGSTCCYEVMMPKDDQVLGVTDFTLLAPGNLGSDSLLQREQFAYWMMREIGLPYNNRRFINVYVNGVKRGSLMEDAVQPSGDVISAWFPDDHDGDLMKIEDWFEFDLSGDSHPFNADATLENFTTANGEKKTARYRWNWRKRAVQDSPNNYTNLFALVDTVNGGSGSAYVSQIEQLVDMDEWMAMMAVRHYVGDWDSYGYQRGKNMYAYKPVNGRWALLSWDISMALGQDSTDPSAPLFYSYEPVISQIYYNNPPFRRAYLRAVQELLDGPLVESRANAILDAKYAAFRAFSINANPASIKTYLKARRTAALNELAQYAAGFAITSNGGQDFSTDRNLLTLNGSAPLGVRTIRVNGVAYPVTWETETTWSMQYPLELQNNPLLVEGYHRRGQLYSNATDRITVKVTGPIEQPQDHVVINEIMYHSSRPDAEFVELYNTSSVGAFGLSGYRLNGADFTFPTGTILPPNGFVVVARNRAAFAAAYGNGIPVVGEYSGRLDHNGETLSLIKPGATPGEEILLSRVRYDSRPPWPPAANGTGVSLQLIDPLRDNNRVANWAVVDTNNVPPQQWRFVSVTGVASSSRLYLYLDAAGEVYLDDLSLVPGDTPSVGGNKVWNGDFESLLAPPWNVSPNHSATAISERQSHSGKASLHLIAESGGSTQTSSVWQDTLPLVLGQRYTLSYWYLPDPRGSSLTIRLSGSGIVSEHSVKPSTRPLALATPGVPNSVLGSLPSLPPLWINEIQTSNTSTLADHAGHYGPWLELYNGGTNEVQLGDLFLSNDYATLVKWAFPPDASLKSKQFLVVWLDGATNESTPAELHAGFQLTNGAGSVVLALRINDQPRALDYLDFGPVPTGLSFGLFPDGRSGSEQLFHLPTPGATNTSTVTSVAVWINEWMANNAHTVANPVGGGFDDWFELYNPSPSPVDLAGYHLTDNLGDTNGFTVPAGRAIPAGGFLLVWADGTPSRNTNQADLHVNFKLAQEGESIGLFAPDGTPVDTVSFGPQKPDVSQGRWPDGQGLPFAAFPVPTPRRSNVLPGSRYAPVLEPIPDCLLTLGRTLTSVVSATDADQPPQVLTFSLGANAPVGAALQPDGRFAWTPSALGLYSVTVRVTDDGSPRLSDERTFQVSVVAADGPRLLHAAVSASSLSISWQADAGVSYQVQYKDDLNDAVWLNAGPPLTGAAATPLTDLLTVTNTQRFYRIMAK